MDVVWIRRLAWLISTVASTAACTATMGSERVDGGPSRDARVGDACTACGFDAPAGDAAPSSDGGPAPDAPVANDSGAVGTWEELLSLPGAAFTLTTAEPFRRYDVGERGVVYRAVRVELDVDVGPFQPEIPDDGMVDRTEHILFGLFRANRPRTDERYLMGSAAVSFATRGPHFRMFGRVSIGSGYMTYTQWSTRYPWPMTRHHLDCLLDGDTHLQTCTLDEVATEVSALTGDVAYLDPAMHLSSGLYLVFGTNSPNEIEVAPIDWAFHDVRITASR